MFGLQSVNTKWRSPITMPAKAIQDHLIIEENTVKRVQEINAADLMNMELATEHTVYDKMFKDFINHFNSLYANPRKWKDGTEYVCYVWDMDSFKRWYCLESKSKSGSFHKERDYKGDIIYYWKGKPLTIYPKAYFEFFKARVE